MNATVYCLPSTNPHNPPCGCPPCRDQRRAEREARDRHPAGTDIAARTVDRWDVFHDQDTVYADVLDVDDELMLDAADICGRFQILHEDQSRDRSEEELALVDDFRDLVRVALTKARAEAVSLALTNHARQVRS